MREDTSHPSQWCHHPSESQSDTHALPSMCAHEDGQERNEYSSVADLDLVKGTPDTGFHFAWVLVKFIIPRPLSWVTMPSFG